MSWTDPDLKSHVDSEDALNISLFLDKFTIVNSDSVENDNYKLKRNPGYNSITIYHPSLSKLTDASISYESNFNTESRKTKLIGKPMTKSYNVYSRVDFYQFLLYFNNLFSITEFETGSSSSTISFPNNTTMTKIFSDIMTAKSSPAMKKIDKTEDIDEITEMLANATNADYNLTNLISEKTYISVKDFEKLIETPIFQNYLTNQLSSYLEKIGSNDEITLNDMLAKMLNEIKNYIRTNAEE